MKIMGIVAAIALAATAAMAQSGIERLYVLDCGINLGKDQSRWSPGVNHDKPQSAQMRYAPASYE